MPIYEFECEDCGAEFDELVAAGTERSTCPECGSERTRRRFSAPAPAFRLVKSRGDARKQEAANRKLHTSAKAQFKERRRKARESAKAKRKGGPGG
jgi:putative FmdB family regulatory protein